MALNVQNVYADIIARLAADTAVKAQLGTPPRVYLSTPPNVVLPFCKLTPIASGPWTHVKGSVSDQLDVQFNTYAQSQATTEVSAANAAIRAVMDVYHKTQSYPLVWNVAECICYLNMVDYDLDSHSAMAVCAYRIAVQALT